MESQLFSIHAADQDPNDVPSIEELNDSWFHWDRSGNRGSVSATERPTRSATAPIGDELADHWFR
jgi:hypothetical protein